MARTAARWIVGLLAGIILLAGLAVVVVHLVARSDWGMEQARRLALRALEDRLAGTLTIERVSGENLLSGIVVHGVEVRDSSGAGFAAVDSIALRYRALDMLWSLFGRVVIGPVTLYGPDARIAQMPGDTLWNFDRIFRTGGPDEDDDGPSRELRLHSVRIVDGRALVMRPVDGPIGGLTARLILRDTLGGRVQVMRFENIDAVLDRVDLSRPGDDSRVIEVERLATRAKIFAQPTRVSDVRGRVTIRDSVIGLELARLRLGASNASVNGRILRSDAGTGLDLQVESRAFELADATPLDERIPEQGKARFTLELEGPTTDRLTLMFRGLEVDAPGARASGDFGYATGPRPQLRGVDLELDAVDLGFLEDVMGRELPVGGTLAGRVRAEGPLARVQTQGDVRLTGWGGAASPDVRWTGIVALEGPLVASGLEAEFANVDLTLLDRFRDGVGLEGLASGRLDLTGRLDSLINIRAVVRHQLGEHVSVLDGGGTLRVADDDTDVNMDFAVQPLRLETVARRVEQLERLRGEARGRITVRGQPDDLAVVADVVTAGGPLFIAAGIDRRGERPIIDGSARSTGFEPAGIGLADAEIKVAGDLWATLQGRETGELTGPVRVELDSGRVAGFPLERSRAWLRLGDGVARADSVYFRAPGLRGQATGAFGLTAAHRDTLHVTVESTALSALEPVLFDQIADPTVPRIAGAGRAELRLVGSIDGFDATGHASLQDLRVDQHDAAAADIFVSASAVRTDSIAWQLDVTANRIRAFGAAQDSARGFVAEENGTGRIELETWRRGETSIRTAAGYTRTETGSDWRIPHLEFRSGSGAWQLADTARLGLGPRSLHVSGVRLLPSSGGELNIGGTLAWFEAPVPSSADAAVDFTVALRRVPVSLIPIALRPSGEVRGLLSGSATIAGTASEPVITGHVEAVDVSYEGAGLERLESDLNYRDRKLNLQAAAFLESRAVMRGTGTIPIDLSLGAAERRVLPEPLEFRVAMDSFPAGFVLGIARAGFTQMAGVFDGTIEASGPATEPKLSGALALRGGAATWAATGVRYTNAEGTFLMNRELRATVDLSARTSDPEGRTRGGTARVSGTIDLSHPADPGFDLVLLADRLLAARRRDMQVTASGRINIDGRYTQPVLTGEVRVDRGAIYLDELYRQTQIVQLEDPLLFGIIDTSFTSGGRSNLPETESPFLRNLRIDTARVVLGSDSWMRSREMNVEMTGEMVISYNRGGERASGAAASRSIVITGSLRAVRGTYRLEYPPFARVFEVTEGTVDFPGTPGIDPGLDITAVYTARTGGEALDIYADVGGTLQAPRISLRSDIEPPISESDLASYLFFGAPTSAFAFSSATATGGLFSNLGAATGLGYVASGLQSLGQSFGLVDYVGVSAAEAAPRGQAGLGDLLAASKIELGRYITPRLFIIYTQPLSNTTDPGVRVEWRFHPTFTAEAFSEDRFARTPSFGLSQAIAARRVYGFFFYREWGYR